ncbi:ATP-dependent (S)-NAD(P)H-hydrate dehydratase [Strongyloides ratti]|uniref:ATP-dependent (S)-NAD(P)H-hydrate dehydratase n=1 Tax=Strongyloides ratti TaxID=34506 RepID=A0A090LFS6_STRRB|nr:ATP-dependent (S)-NAD(P)H-hydrate dehydratase [Strongyloides ratti]CEF68612.1 ATP-dependent (S)-NAD(P)H-hydrate dehydratase [Strongyloides ratti]
MPITKILPRVKVLLPALSPCYRKGDCGKIAVIGGSEEYTGAPYFSAITLLKIGCDLSYVICPKEAAPIIKSYSPELIVYPALNETNFSKVCNRINSIVIGPGLGREVINESFIAYVISSTKEKDNITSVIIDADGLHFCTKYPDIIKNHSKVILTPNAFEFEKLYNTIFPENQLVDESDLKNAVKKLAKELGVIVMRKGVIDIISDGNLLQTGEMGGSPRRCGGQGDILSGAVAAFTYFLKKSQSTYDNIGYVNDNRTLIDGVCAASDLIRYTAQKTFNDKGRSMTATDMIDKICEIINELDRNY